MTGTPWYETPLVAVDLEGSGAQDRETEAILEIAAVPITGGQPDMDNAYCTLVNPGRPIPKRPWISPGLTNHTLRDAPTLDAVEPTLAARLNGRYLVGHNIGVDWRVLHRRCPTIQPAGLIDTLRLARNLGTTASNGLAKLVTAYNLTTKIDTLAVGSQPHRALWDTVAAAVLLLPLIHQRWPAPPTLDDLTNLAGLALDSPPTPATRGQPSLFDG
ncbi:3'-5' exonuclease [Natronosporangium hydrolyticum]|uniref:3'-5' exonuclease n=1 Tax=Natronosporangium hydrolyticum TaxID=2811111 RepID=A0A895YFL1_9ACTN|nr:3'-5' exonuclease [Natronosporangium hydrolyticum]QSB12970.1 3'-5' exonuclease [Natronosporangium hydrolyticum]